MIFCFLLLCVLSKWHLPNHVVVIHVTFLKSVLTCVYGAFWYDSTHYSWPMGIWEASTWICAIRLLLYMCKLSWVKIRSRKPTTFLIHLYRRSSFTNESSIGCLDIIGHRWLCLVNYYILIKLVIALRNSEEQHAFIGINILVFVSILLLW